MRIRFFHHGCSLVITVGLTVSGNLWNNLPHPVKADFGDLSARDRLPQEVANPILQQTQLISQYDGPGQVRGRRRGTGQRSDCLAVANGGDLVAIVPAQPPYVGGLTTSERPTFWFYVPYALNDNVKAEFILQDSDTGNRTQINSTTFSMGTTPGLIRLSLPADQPGLEVGKLYRWYFKVFCGSEPEPLTVEGGIERGQLDLALEQQLEAASPQERAKLYVANNFWYDAIDVMGGQWRSQPENPAVVNEWQQLLQSLGLDDIARIFPNPGR